MWTCKNCESVNWEKASICHHCRFARTSIIAAAKKLLRDTFRKLEGDVTPEIALQRLNELGKKGSKSICYEWMKYGGVVLSDLPVNDDLDYYLCTADGYEIHARHASPTSLKRMVEMVGNELVECFSEYGTVVNSVSVYSDHGVKPELSVYISLSSSGGHRISSLGPDKGEHFSIVRTASSAFRGCLQGTDWARRI